ncbi:MAG: nucleoside kinase [Defluviitaleaceae bacterium]|nr:nucleoside kinase [Defluviitaleaceae bacterium]
MPEMIKVIIVNEGTYTVKKGTTLQELSRAGAKKRKNPAIVACVDNELSDLSRNLLYDCTVEFLDATTQNGFRTYQRSVAFLMVYAVKTVLGKRERVVVAHSINKNYYCELPGLKKPITDELLGQIEGVMREAAEKKIPIEKHTLPVESALREMEAVGLYDKVQLLSYRKTASVNLYRLDWLYDYFYGQMAPDAGVLDVFKLKRRSDGFMLFFKDETESDSRVKVSEVIAESSNWARILKADTVGALNDKLCQEGSGEIVRVAEALHEKKLASLADSILHGRKHIVLIAGPSSSGKTTFASRLGIQLRVNGMKPIVISLDNYYLNRDKIPLDEFGSPDFETIEAIDTRQVDSDLSALQDGKTVELPFFNFQTGRREYKGRVISLADPSCILVIEGIHGLNDKIGASVPSSGKYKIFISALTQLNIDDHNRIPTSDTRLVRRIVRDYLYRGYSAKRTIELWPSVQRGESKYIFPFQEDADAFFNSALVYEMCVLKQFVEPLLFGVGKDEPEHTEAKRLVKFLDSFLGISSENVPPNSILREFIGGSCFSG